MARALSTSDASRNAPAGHLSRDLPVRQDGVPVLQVRDLDVRFPSENGSVHAVRGVDLTVHAGEIVCVVGESGSGKSVTSTSVMGLLPDQAKVSGSVKLHGTELLGRDDAWMSKVRGKQMGMVFQDPLSALTPVYTVGDQIVEALTVHGGTSEADARTRAVELLELVGIPNPKVRVKAFPHEFSGGMRQRAMIAIAIANNPDLIIADEPTTALDVTIQAQILDVLRTAQQETGAGVVFITHDLGVVASMADRVAVMYAGRIVERGEVHEIFERARMPYTIGLLGSLPRLDDVERKALAPVEGNPPSLLNLPPGCPFAPRCPMAVDECRTVEPALEPIDDAQAGAEAVAVPAAGGAPVEVLTVSRGDYARFAEATGRAAAECGRAGLFGGKRSWRTAGDKTGDAAPVACVSAADAQAYATWLGSQGNGRHRLPSAGELRAQPLQPIAGWTTLCADAACTRRMASGKVRALDAGRGYPDVGIRLVRAR